MPEFDPGPTGAFATHWDNRPSYSAVKARFRMNWGPIYYRGRFDRTARVIIIGQDPLRMRTWHAESWLAPPASVCRASCASWASTSPT
jgi:hypothetical protein